MAGYRPKSLDELNSMYDKTIAAEKAIKRGTSLLEKAKEEKVAAEQANDIQKIIDEILKSQEISDTVSEFAATYNKEDAEEKKAAEEIHEETAKPKPQMTVLVPDSPRAEKVSFELSDDSADSPEETSAEALRNDRNNLIDDYMRIMNDEEDEVPQKKLSRKEKKKLKMKEKQEAAKALTEEPEQEFNQEVMPEPAVEPEQEIETQNAPEVLSDKAPEIQQIEISEQPTEPESFDVPQYEAYSEPEDNEAAQNTADESGEEDDEFHFPENYTPGWIEEDEAAEKEEAKEKSKKSKNKKEKKQAKPEPKKSSNHTILKSFLCIILMLLITVSAFATSFKTIFAVNTGKIVNDTFYFFTASKDYTELNITKGDFIITEKKYAEDGDVFAYVDYSEKTFEFGKRSDSITNDNGEILLVTEKDGNRTLVAENDCKGVIFASYPSIGMFIGILTDNFIVIIAASAVAALAIILILSLALKNKGAEEDEDEDENDNRYDNGDTEEEITEEIEFDEVNLFATID